MNNIYLIEYSYGSIHDNGWAYLNEAYSNVFDAEKRKEEFVKEMTSLTPFPLDYITYEKIKEGYWCEPHFKNDEDRFKYYDWLDENSEPLNFNSAQVKEIKFIK